MPTVNLLLQPRLLDITRKPSPPVALAYRQVLGFSLSAVRVADDGGYGSYICPGLFWRILP